MTRDELANRIKYTLGLQDDTSFNETNYVNDLIYEGITDIVARTRPYTRCLNMPVIPNTPVHDMADVIISLLDISDGNGMLDRFSREDIERIQRQGGRGYCYEEPLLWIAPVSSEERTIQAYGVFRPQKMPTGTDSPSHPDYGGLAGEFHPTILTYCFWKGGEYVQHEASGNGEKWRVQYEGQDGLTGELSKIKRILAKRVTPGGARRRSPLRSVGSVPDLTYYAGG